MCFFHRFVKGDVSIMFGELKYIIKVCVKCGKMVGEPANLQAENLKLKST